MRVRYTSNPLPGRDCDIYVDSAIGGATIQVWLGSTMLGEARCDDPPCHEAIHIPSKVAGASLRIVATDDEGAESATLAVSDVSVDFLGELLGGSGSAGAAYGMGMVERYEGILGQDVVEGSGYYVEQRYYATGELFASEETGGVAEADWDAQAQVDDRLYGGSQHEDDSPQAETSGGSASVAEESD